MKIIIGNKNYSSWSLRGWLKLSRTGVEFDAELIQLDIDGFKDRILSHSTAGQVPILKHDGQKPYGIPRPSVSIWRKHARNLSSGQRIAPSARGPAQSAPS